MQQKSMTALISAFARGYHATHNETKIFDDFLADKILTNEEKEQITLSMSKGIKFFNPEFSGTNQEALRWIVDNQLSPSPLGRAAWAEKALETAVKIGTTQYLVVAAGYDTFAYRHPAWASTLQVFEFDHPFMSEDKQRRAQTLGDKKPSNLTYIPIDLSSEPLSSKIHFANAYSSNELSFCSLLGISYYLPKEDFGKLLLDIASLIPDGSAIAFDYPDEYTYTPLAGERAKKQTMMATGANEKMLASYSYNELEQLLSDC